MIPSFDDLIRTLVAAAAASPLLAVFVYMWWSERTDRRTLQAKYDELTERVIKGLSDATEVCRAVIQSQNAQNMTTEVIKNLLISRLGAEILMPPRDREDDS